LAGGNDSPQFGKGFHNKLRIFFVKIETLGGSQMTAATGTKRVHLGPEGFPILIERNQKIVLILTSLIANILLR